MELVNHILNIGGMMLWLSWLAVRFDPLTQADASPLAGTLKKTDAAGPRQWLFLAGLLAMLLARAWMYWLANAVSAWTPRLELGMVALPFPKAPYLCALLFSLLSFGSALAIFYLWMLLLSVANRSVTDDNPFQRLVRAIIKGLDRWPVVLKLLLPFLLGAMFWISAHPVLAHFAVVPESRSIARLLEQSVLIGVGVYLAWEYLVVAVLILHMLNSYVHLGKHPVWGYMDVTARNLLHPLRWLPLRFGRVDLRPLAAVALVILAGNYISNLPAWLPVLIW